MQLRCRTCGVIHDAPRLPVGGIGAQCAGCGAGLWKKKPRAPGPIGSLGALLRGLWSVPGVLFALVYTALDAVPIGVLIIVAPVMLYVVAVGFACKAMLLENGGRVVDLPEVNGDELLDVGWLFRVVVHSLLFLIGPLAVFVMGVVVAAPWDRVLFAAAIVAALYGPMALILMLRAHSLWGMFQLPLGARLFARDPIGYGAIVGAFVVVHGSDVLLRVALPGLVIGRVNSFAHAFLVLLLYGMCGLYIRKHARLLDAAVDDDDWEPILQVVMSEALAPVARAQQPIDVPEWEPQWPPRQQRAPISLPAFDPTPVLQEAPAWPPRPVAAPASVEPAAPTENAPASWPPRPPKG